MKQRGKGKNHEMRRASSAGGALRPLNANNNTNNHHKKTLVRAAAAAAAAAASSATSTIAAAAAGVPKATVTATQRSEARQRVHRRMQRVLASTVQTARDQVNANPNYFTVVQRGKFTPAVRASVVVWMQRCSLHFQLLPETTETAIHMFDRFLSMVYIPGDKHVRVVGVACLFLASKLTESMEDGPCLRDLVVASGAAFSVNDIMRMERIILQKLTWNVGAIVTNTMVTDAVLLALTKNANGEDNTIATDVLSPQDHEAMYKHTQQSLRDIQTHAHFIKYDPAHMGAAACVVAALRVTPTADVKRVYSVMCDLTKTDDVVVSQCASELENFTAEVAPMF